jgi:flagellar basal body rod protein FlgG
MNRNSTIICSAVLLAGASSGFIGGLWYAGKRDQPAEATPSVISETGWEFTSGAESGPALVVGPNPLALSSMAPAESDLPDMAWFPDAIGETSAAQNSKTAPNEFPIGTQSISSGPLTPEQQQIWKDQLKRLPAGEAEQLLQIRQRLNSKIPEELSGPPSEAPGLIKPLSATEATEPGGASPPISAPAEPGRFTLPDADALRPALPAGPLLPPDIDLASGSRAAPVSVSPLLKHVLEVARLNRANAATVGYRRREVLVLCVESPSDGESPVTPKAETSGDPLLQVSAETPVPAASRDEERHDWVTRLDLRAGKVVETGNSFDIAIAGTGWLRVRCNGEDVVTRCGLLAINKENQLTVRTGAGMLPLKPVITLPGDLTRLEIANDGTVLAHLADASEAKDCGKIELFSFRDAGQLAWSAKGFYEATATSGKPFPLESSRVIIRQAHLEQSNVDLQRESEAVEQVRLVMSADKSE